MYNNCFIILIKNKNKLKFFKFSVQIFNVIILLCMYACRYLRKLKLGHFGNLTLDFNIEFFKNQFFKDEIF